MALRASTLVDGAWTTTTFGVDDVLKAHNHEQQTTKLLDVEKPPTVGILTQTVIRSPLVHWILPVRLRGPRVHDVAFIGVRELRPDGLLWDVIRKENFGTRIRNACVVGSVEAYKQDPDVRNGSPEVKDEDEDEDVLMTARESPGRQPVAGVLPPQYLLIQLETGDSVFLMLHQSENGKLEFITSRYRVSKVMLDLQPGMHLAVDPSSRYMAVGCSEGVFAIYALHSRNELKSQFVEGSKLRYVEAETYVYFTGVIVKMDFLYPSPDDEGHIILLALVVIKGKTRMLTWEWETGSELKHIRARSLRGHLVEESRRIPQLLIPLRTKSSFILICEDSMAVCEDLLQGAPTFIGFNSKIDPPSAHHHGSGTPLWTSWARPARMRARRKTTEDIYIVREDGIIKILEVDTSDASVTLDHIIGELESNSGKAMACLDCWMASENGDLLVTGGDSCTGGTYLIRAREGPKYMEPIQNWSPAQDFVTTFEGQDRDMGDGNSKSGSLISKPDRIFACGGKGVKGAITEFRYGLEASIGLEMDYGVPITQSWILYPQSDSPDDHGASNFLMTIGDHSAVLRLSDDILDVRELDQDSTPFNLGFRTIAASMQGSSMIQVTEKSITVVSQLSSYTYTADELLCIHSGGVSLGSGNSIWNAAIGRGVVFFTTFLDNAVWLQLLDLEDTSNSMDVDSDSLRPPKGRVRTIKQFSLNVTALSIGVINAKVYAILAEKGEDSITLSYVPLVGATTETVNVASTYGNRRSRLEGIVSIAIAQDKPGHLLLLCGTRNGVLVTLELNKDTFELLTCKYHNIGITTMLVTLDEHTEDLFFVNCDSKVYAVRPRMSAPLISSPRRWLQQIQIDQVWLCDNARPAFRPPNITSTARLRPNLSGGIGGSMLFVADSQLLIARLSLQPKAVPRHLIIKCTPTRLMFSSTLNVLVVAASLNGRSTILFFDPDTGDNLSEPIDPKTKAPVDFVSGLGNPSERIFRLFEWTFKKDRSIWYYIVVATSSGRVLVISIDNLDKFREDMQKRSHIEQNSDNGKGIQRPKIRYLMKHKFRGKDPATAVIGFPQGIIWSHGDRIFCEALNTTEKRFETVGKYRLPSPAINLSYDNDRIYVLTTTHSLEILQMVDKPGGGYDLVRTHGDAISRAALHHTIIDYPPTRPIHLVSDKMCSLVGLWPTENTKAETLEPIFEAQLPYSVLRFRFARCRPIWDPVWTSIGRTLHHTKHEVLSLENRPNSMSRSETLGLSINGALSHYSILDATTWEFLRFLIDLATRSPKVCEFTFKDSPIPLGVYGPVTEPKLAMQIDGDILRQCLELRVLETLLKLHVKNQEADMIFERFVQLLQALHLGTLSVTAAKEVYIEQAYLDLAFFLRPVL